jgi:hypothetical protein
VSAAVGADAVADAPRLIANVMPFLLLVRMALAHVASIWF